MPSLTLLPLFVLLALLALLSLPSLLSSAAAASIPASSGVNDFACRSASQPYPVVLFHGLGATFYEDLNVLQSFLASKGFCTFAITYGDYEGFPFVGGLRPVDESAQELGQYVAKVKSQTGAEKVDVVGHSEGGFMALYVPKFTSTGSLIRKSFAIAPPSHGTTFGNLITLAKTLGADGAVEKVIRTVGCDACSDLVVGSRTIQRLNDGPIAQPGIQYTILTSKYDELVTPAPQASFVQEAGVRNLVIQDVCPNDPVGHIGEAYDTNTWNLVLNELQDKQDRSFSCSLGSPGRR